MRLWNRLFLKNAATFRIRFGLSVFQIPKRADGDYILEKMERRGRFYEEDLLKALQLKCPNKTTVLDCGANIGNHTLFFSGVMGATVIAFEPIPANAVQLNKLIALNQLEGRVSVAQNALGDEEGEISLSLPDPANPGMYRVSDEAGGTRARIMRLDAYLDQESIDIADIGLVKIDVEGFEANVVAGATTLLGQGKAVLAIELAGQAAFDEVYDLIKPFGYHPTAVYCHTPTVIFEKCDLDADILRKVLAVQTAFDNREGTA